MPIPRTPAGSIVQPNTLSGESEPNTLSSMGRSPTARSVAARAANARTAAGSSAGGGWRTSSPARAGGGLLARLISWVLILAVAYFLLMALGR